MTKIWFQIPNSWYDTKKKHKVLLNIPTKLLICIDKKWVKLIVNGKAYIIPKEHWINFTKSANYTYKGYHNKWLIHWKGVKTNASK